MKTVSGEDEFRALDLPRAIWYFLGEERKKYLFFWGVLLLVLCFNMVPPYFIGLIANFLIDYIGHVGDKPSIAPLFWFVGMLAVANAIVALVRLSSKRMLGRMSLNARYRAKVQGFERLLDFSLSWHQQESTGNKAQRIITGSEAIREWTSDIITQASTALVVVIGSLVAGLLLSPWFGFFFLYYLGVLFGIERYFDYRISRLSDRINRSIENASGSFVESAANILAVKAMGAADGMTGNVAQREELARKLSYERLRLSNTKWMCYQIHNSMCWAGYLIIVGFMVMKGHLAAGFFVTYAAYFDKLRDASTDFADRIQTMIERKSNLGRMMPIFWGNHSLSKGERKFPANWQRISIDKAVFRYGDKPAIGPLTVTIQRGEIIGVAGHSGSGKSTLIKLLLGLYHLESGSIRIGEESIPDIRHEELTSHVAVVLQETELFNFTLRENLTMMRDVPAEVVERACHIACLQDLIARLPEGLDTVVGERGYSLSGGERQRVGIARAVCRNAPILLLDEATSALDSATEQRVMDGLLRHRGEDQTMIIVAHRISTLKEADKILVFERGQLVEEGSFHGLSHDASTRFGGMYAIQQA
ncbi:ABC transporter ATP-binding protein [Uliginosibacterium sp. sgz301328]|uniref:ABC transporter ATP-binding protein n=1 Tax=Uliginosibacterium sp. sgz301328 TaxID=3243764 RepID=UPI00359DED81